ncbi:unnamed protein product [Musa acuminata subsp. malaccensis]|uniref:(wild Malaysian banana) hypothetical protein n=1 Tax=Musa acuminata subsp. malaccensis TaxID=214687 RepID=A0A8D7FDQ4_MUSAM|nr:unnamed protein product [Musa acuminata subsp. malaccensis]
MRRFFSLRSSTSNSGNSNTAAPAPNNQKKNVKVPACDGVPNASQSPRETVLKPCNRYLDDEDSLKSLNHRRSLSFSSATTNYGMEEKFLSDFSRSPSNCRNTLNHVDNCPIHCQSSTPERASRKKRGDLAAIQYTRDVEFDSSGSRENCSSGNSSCGSPVPLRCRASHMSTSNKTEFHDFYIDGEPRVKFNQDHTSHSSGTEVDGCLADKNVLPCPVRPPRVQYMKPMSPTYDKENFRSYSFRETNHLQRCSTQDWAKDDIKLASPSRKTRRNAEKLFHAFAGKFLKPQDYDSRTTTTIDDVNDDFSDAQPSLTSNGFSEMHESEITSSCEDVKDCCTEELTGFQRHKCSLRNAIMDANVDNIFNTRLQEEETNEELQRKVKELEEKLKLLSEENPEMMKYRSKSSNLTAMLKIIQNINEDRKILALELSSQIRSRLSERFSAKERFKQSKAELDTRTRRLEKEKNEIQSSLERELDRRSNDWSLKLAKFLSEEQRLRERVRELAEQNVALQREISSLKVNEVEAQGRMLNSDRQMNELTACLEDVRTKNHDLHQSLSELQDRYSGSEEDRDCLRRCYKEKEKENKELQEVVVKLQRVCSEQEKSISGLRRGYSDDLCKKVIEEGDNISRLQMEQLRLTGVEQMLRKEVESCRLEMESLRHENISLLDRLQGTHNGYGHSFIKLDRQLHARVDHLQTQGLSLLDKNSCYLGDLLEFIKRRWYQQDTSMDFDGFSVDEYILKYQSLKRGIENFRRNLQTILTTLDEKSNLDSLLCHVQTIEDGKPRQLKSQVSEDEMLLNLRAEAILSRVLKENLCSRELEYEQLQADFATSVRARGILQTANQRLQDELSCLTHKMKDLELQQILKKDETISQLHQEMQFSMRDLTSVQSVLQNVSQEKEQMWEEVKQLRKTNMLLENEVSCLRKKIETLDEDILLKEGQISILKDSMEQFVLE